MLHSQGPALQDPEAALSKEHVKGTPLSASALMHALPWRQRKGSPWGQKELPLRCSILQLTRSEQLG